DKVTTDHIMPAGNKLKYRSNIPVYAKYVFEPLDKDFAERCLQNKQKNLHNVIVGGESYGQGSSREHAAICPMYLGVKAVIAKSFERIHTANLVNFGIIPFTFATSSQYDVIQKGEALVIPNIRQIIANHAKSNVIAVYGDSNHEITLNVNLSPRERKIILAGGFLNYIRETMNKH
ncbi:MAG: aconitate hydratase, partial [Promethearchaeota archaeon CR_4]